MFFQATCPFGTHTSKKAPVATLKNRLFCFFGAWQLDAPKLPNARDVAFLVGPWCSAKIQQVPWWMMSSTVYFESHTSNEINEYTSTFPNDVMDVHEYFECIQLLTDNPWQYLSRSVLPRKVSCSHHWSSIHLLPTLLPMGRPVSIPLNQTLWLWVVYSISSNGKAIGSSASLKLNRSHRWSLSHAKPKLTTVFPPVRS